MHLIRCDATMKPTLPTRISHVLDKFKFKFKFNDRSELWDILRKLDGTSTAPQNKQFSYVSKQVTMQTFPNTIAILHYMYITYIKKCNLFACFDTKLNTTRQCHPRTGKHDTIRSVLIPHSSSCEKDQGHET